MKKIFGSILITFIMLWALGGSIFAAAPTDANITISNGVATLNADLTLTSQWNLNDAPTGTVTGNWSTATTLNLNNNKITIDSSTSTLSDFSNPTGYIYSFPGIVIEKSFSIQGPGTIEVSSNSLAGTGAITVYNPSAATINVDIGNNITVQNLIPTGKAYTIEAAGATGTGPSGNNIASITNVNISGPNTQIIGTSAIMATGSYSLAVGGGMTNPQKNTSQVTTVSISDTTLKNLPSNTGEAVVRNFGQDSGTSIIELGNGTVVEGTGVAGVYGANAKGQIEISGDASIEGYTGVVVRGGSLSVSDDASITANGSYLGNAASVDNATGNGSAIFVQGVSSPNNYYGDIDINVSGDPTLKSEYGSALDQQTPEGSYETNIDNIDISGGTFTGASDKEAVVMDSPKAENSISGGSFSSPVSSNLLSNKVVASVAANGETSYFTNVSDAETYAAANKGTVTVFTPAPEPVDPNENEGIMGVALDTTPLNYYLVSKGTSEQSEDLGLVISSIPANSYLANSLTWTLTNTENKNDVITIASPTTSVWTPGTDSAGNYMSASNGPWTIKQYYTVDVATDGTKTNNPGTTQLVFNGTTETAGIYSLTASAPDFYNVSILGTVIPEASVLVIVNEPSDVAEVVITDLAGEPVSSLQTIDLSEQTTAQYSYIAYNAKDEAVNGNIVEWSLKGAEGVAYINQKTGLITFYGTTSSSYLVLYVTVDGVPSNSVVLNVVGQAENMGIAPYTNPAYAQTSQNVVAYSITNNLVMMPGYTPLSAEVIKNLTYESSNPNIIVTKAGNVIVTTPNYVGTTVITATYTDDDDNEYTASFELNLVAKALNATGLTAEPELNFIYGETPGQSVNAQLAPEGTTTPIVPANVDYSSANENVAIVTDFGEVYATGTGSTTITSSYVLNVNGTSKKVTAKTTVNVMAEAPVATNIEMDPISVSLTTVEGGQTTYEVTANVTPTQFGSLEWSSSAPTVATVASTGMNTATITAVAEGEAVITATYGDISASTTVIVSDAAVYAEEIAVTAETPDYYTVTVTPAVNTAAGYTGSVEQVTIFTWSEEDRSDANYKVANRGADGTFSYTFPVNDTEVNNYYDYADEIVMNIYGSTTDGENGNMIGAATYKSVNTMSAQDNAVAYIAYVAYEGFEKPTVFDGQTAGKVDSGVRCEGVRISSNIAGVDINTSVHAENIGWMDAEVDGAYAGTMHESRQIEALNLTLSGANADMYELSYRVYQAENGWSEWVTAGQDAGVIGQHDMMEAFEVQLLPVAE